MRVTLHHAGFRLKHVLYEGYLAVHRNHGKVTILNDVYMTTEMRVLGVRPPEWVAPFVPQANFGISLYWPRHGHRRLGIWSRSGSVRFGRISLTFTIRHMDVHRETVIPTTEILS